MMNRRRNLGMLCGALWPCVAGASTVLDASLDVLEIRVGMWRVHGPSWDLRVDADGEARFSHSRGGGGSVLGDFRLKLEAVRALVATTRAMRFVALPKSLSPSPAMLHAPEYLAEVRTAAGSHRVQVYHPQVLPVSDELTRFFGVWDAVWTLMPFRPPMPEFKP